MTFTLGIKPKAERTALMFATMSSIFFVVIAIMNLIFAFVNFNKPIFIILNGVILLVYALIASGMAKLSLNIKQLIKVDDVVNLLTCSVLHSIAIFEKNR